MCMDCGIIFQTLLSSNNMTFPCTFDILGWDIRWETAAMPEYNRTNMSSCSLLSVLNAIKSCLAFRSSSITTCTEVTDCCFCVLCNIRRVWSCIVSTQTQCVWWTGVLTGVECYSTGQDKSGQRSVLTTGTLRTLLSSVHSWDIHRKFIMLLHWLDAIVVVVVPSSLFIHTAD